LCTGENPPGAQLTQAKPRSCRVGGLATDRLLQDVVEESFGSVIAGSPFCADRRPPLHLSYCRREFAIHFPCTSPFHPKLRSGAAQRTHSSFPKNVWFTSDRDSDWKGFDQQDLEDESRVCGHLRSTDRIWALGLIPADHFSR